VAAGASTTRRASFFSACIKCRSGQQKIVMKYKGMDLKKTAPDQHEKNAD
jgi:hypothetical protein